MKIQTNITKSYASGIEAVEDCGFEEIGIIEMNKNFKRISRTLLEKENKLYYYVGMDHFNTTVYNVTLNPIENLSGDYEIVRY